jgi:hypothetical protein
MTTAPKIFISYSHRDEEWKERLSRSLRILERKGLVDLWDTSDIEAGAKWSQEIGKALKSADVALLLISPSFLESDFVVQNELPALLERSRQGGLVVLPILLRPSLWTHVPGLAELQFLNDPSKPLAALSENERDQALADISSRVASLVEAVAEQKIGRRESPTRRRPDIDKPFSAENVQPLFFISHSRADGDFAELLKLRMEREGFAAWIDIDRLGPGVDWRQGIDDAIKTSAALIAIMSPEARQSEYVTYEWAFGWGGEIKIIPLMLRETSLHPRLATLQYLDFTNRMARPWSRLFEALNEAKRDFEEGRLTLRSSGR